MVFTIHQSMFEKVPGEWFTVSFNIISVKNFIMLK